MTDDTTQLTREQIENMRPSEIAVARRAGRLNALLGIPTRPARNETDQLGLDDLRSMTRADVHAALRRGQFAHLLSNIN